LTDQLLRDSQRCTGLMGQRLSASQPGIRCANWAGDSEHLAITFEHDERSILIGKPSQSSKRHEAVGSNDYESLQPVADAGHPQCAALGASAVFNLQMTALHPHLDSKTGEGEHTAFANEGFADRVGVG